MTRLHFDYYMQIDYSLSVARCNYTIKCIPKDTSRQKVESLMIDMYPPSCYAEGKDGFCNRQIYGVNEEEHSSFYFHIIGNVLTGFADYEEIADESQAMIFRHPHGKNVAGESIRAYYNKIAPGAGEDTLERAIYFMNRLHEDFHYRSHSTDVTTTAEEAFSQGFGVCQDYAHILISLLHLSNITARYANGLIVGEGESHAWVEVLIGDRWIGLDPTHNRKVGEKYIRLGVGRDAGDCALNRGIMHGGGYHTQTIIVNVNELAGVGSEEKDD